MNPTLQPTAVGQSPQNVSYSTSYQPTSSGVANLQQHQQLQKHQQLLMQHHQQQQLQQRQQQYQTVTHQQLFPSPASSTQQHSNTISANTPTSQFSTPHNFTCQTYSSIANGVGGSSVRGSSPQTVAQSQPVYPSQLYQQLPLNPHQPQLIRTQQQQLSLTGQQQSATQSFITAFPGPAPHGVLSLGTDVGTSHRVAGEEYLQHASQPTLRLFFYMPHSDAY